jgi:hypothetical protein
MTLFDSNPQSRETAAIFRVLSLLPLRMGLAEGRIFRWFAVNIPMSLVPGCRFAGDIDLMCSLRSFPQKPVTLIYKTWEVKVILIDRFGRPRSLKRGKTRNILKQLRVTRRFGSPNVSLLEMYLCEAGSSGFTNFPSEPVFESIQERASRLYAELFGYQLLPFAHGKDGDTDVGVYGLGKLYPPDSTIRILRPLVTECRKPFSELAQILETFVVSKQLGFVIVVFCKTCRRLGLVKMNSEFDCPHCGDYLDSR